MVTEPDVHGERDILPVVRQRLDKDFKITHSIVQCELTPCHQTDEADHFKSATVGVEKRA